MGYFLLETLGWFLMVIIAREFWAVMGETGTGLVYTLAASLALAGVSRLWKWGKAKLGALQRQEEKLEALEKQLDRMNSMLEECLEGQARHRDS